MLNQLNKSVKSSNFWNNIIVTIFGILSIWGIQVPPETAAELIGAINAKDVFAIVIIVVNVVNVVFHFFKDKTLGVLRLEEVNEAEVATEEKTTSKKA